MVLHVQHLLSCVEEMRVRQIELPRKRQNKHKMAFIHKDLARGPKSNPSDRQSLPLGSLLNDVGKATLFFVQLKHQTAAICSPKILKEL